MVQGTRFRVSDWEFGVQGFGVTFDGSGFCRFAARVTRWSTTLSLKVNLPHAINFRALCGANVGLVILHSLGSTKLSYSTECGEGSPSPDESLSSRLHETSTTLSSAIPHGRGSF